MKRLLNKIAIITGSARGIGKTFAEYYIKEGAKVAICDINFELAKNVSKELGQNSFPFRLDVSKRESIQQVVQEVEEKFGQIDILVNNAALFDLSPIVEITEESYNKLYSVNVFGVLFMMQEVVKSMIKKNIKGKIINMASQAGRRGEPMIAVYCSTKAAVISLTQSAGLNLIKHGINVNAIAPGIVDGEHWDNVDSLFAKYENRPLGEKKEMVSKLIPYGRIGNAKDLVGMAIFLASDESDYIVAQTYNVDGGNCMN